MDLDRDFRAPSGSERVFNRFFGFLVGLGLGFSSNYLLQVKGRKSGKLQSTPINLLELGGQQYLVAPRGRTQWVRNAEVSQEVTLKKGRHRARYRLRAIEGEEKLKVLKAYLDQFRREVERYFPLAAGSSPQAFSTVVDKYPAFQLIRLS
ncbi:MAG: nitroreductase family deazaflavin-dependent oxidoreductase [Acidobacteria bacterium]|nr:nitroreductase family deazaflavin-dependent oxidoreductase [Acidobacteriota bacterium]